MFSTKSALFALSLSASAMATVFITSPVASTTFVGGKNSTISWNDNGVAPSLAQFGPSKVSIYAGNSQQQTLLQAIADSVDVSKNSAIVFVPNPSIGPNANQYFIRFESISLKDPANPQYPALAFSAKYSMSGMTGTFSPEVQAQINGQSTAPIGGIQTSSSTGAPSSSAPASTTSAPTSSRLITTTSASATTSARATTSPSSAASPQLANAGTGLAGLLMLVVAML